MFAKNRDKLFAALPEGACAVFSSGERKHKTGDEFYPFSPDRNFYYLTGIDVPYAKALFQKNGTAVLYVERPDPATAKWVGEKLTRGEARVLSGISDVRYLDEFPERLPGRALSETEKEEIMARLRLVKEDLELLRIQKAVDITRKGLEAMLENLRPGMWEYEAEAYFDFVLRQNGVRDKAFETIVASGENSCVLHYTDNDKKMMAGDLLLVDCGARVGHYSGDLTRTYPVSGTFTPRQRQIYDIVLQGNRLVIDAIEPGVPFAKLNELLKAYYFEALREIGLVDTAEDVAKYYYHSVSHFLGADTHDVGDRINTVLEPGMVLTVEPGLYIEEEAIGIRIEDDVLVTESGCLVLSEELPKDADAIEAVMAGAGREGK